MITIGQNPRVLWSCHIDTVAKQGGAQLLSFDPDSGYVSLADGKAGMSLGADDGVGIWIMLEMIAAKRPGLYVFHRGEEVGCLGSRWIVDNTPELLSGIDAAIAFDRAGTSDIITHQVSRRCASDAFARSVARQLNVRPSGAPYGLAYRPDDTGVFTDTNEYVALVPECSNLSVGYYGQHGPRERLDVYHAEALLDRMLEFDATKLVIERDPADTDLWDDGRADYSRTGASSWGLDSFAEAIADNPYAAADLLRELGVSLEDFIDFLWDGDPGSGPFVDDRDDDELSLDWRPMGPH